MKTYMQQIIIELASTAAQTAAYNNWNDAFSRQQIKRVWANTTSVSRQTRHQQIKIADLIKIPRTELYELGFGNWDDKIMLLPLWLYNYIADGEILTCINGEVFTKGKDKIDLDIRSSSIAYGFVGEDP